MPSSSNNDTESALREAITSHQAGRIDDAEAQYRRILTVTATCSDAHHGLGVIAFQRGLLEEAAHAIFHAISLQPSLAHYHENLGKVWRALGRLPEAES